MGGEPDVSAIIVNWNTRRLLEQAVRSLEVGGWRWETPDLTSNLQPPTVELIVVDNASTDGSAEAMRDGFPWVRLTANQLNLGFAAAVNQGLALARGRHILLLNSDARLEDGSLAALVEYLDLHPHVAVLGPQLRNPDGSVQSSRRRLPTLKTAFVESTPLQWALGDRAAGRLLRQYYLLDRSDAGTQSVDWLVGACLLVRRAAIEQVGGLDERFFMYFEEVDWCRRFKAAGWEVVYLPLARAVHEYGKSSERDVLARHIHFNESKCRYVGKYHGPAAERALRLFLFAAFLLQLGVEGLKMIVGHKPGLRRERLETLAAVLRYQAPRMFNVERRGLNV